MGDVTRGNYDLRHCRGQQHREKLLEMLQREKTT